MNFNPSSRHRFLLLYDPAALPLDFPLDSDFETPEPDPPPHKAVRKLAQDGRAFVVEVPAGADCEATMRVFVNEAPPPGLVAKAKQVASSTLVSIPSGTLRADGSEFICLPGQQRINVDIDPPASLPPGDYLLTAHELVHWKLRHRKTEIRARTTPLGRFVDVLTQSFGMICAVLFVAHILVVPAVLWMVWREHGWRTALKIGGIILTVDVMVYLMILLLAGLQKRFKMFNVSDVRKQFDAVHPDFIVVLQSANGHSGSGEIAQFKWPNA